MAATTSDPPVRRLPRRAVIAGWLYALFAVAVVLLGWLGEEPALREAHPGRWLLAALALGSLYALPAVLVLLARRDRPVLLLGAGAVGVALVPTSFSITPLLLLPALMLFSVAPSSRRGPLVAFCLAVLAFGSFWVCVRASDEVCWTTATGGGCGELPPVSSSLLSLGITVAALGGAAATPPDPRARRVA
jgi:hypothetical protein